MEDDDNGRLGMWIAISAALLVVLGTVLSLLWSTLDDGAAPAAAAAKATPSAAAAAPAPAPAPAPAAAAATAAAASTAAAAPAATASADATVDVPLTGDLLGKVYFDIGKAEVGAEGSAAVDAALAAIHAGAPRKVVLSGFHDLSGSPDKNAELAKERAKAVRELLKSNGIGAERIILRKPDEAASGGAPEEARRVEIRLVD